MGLLVIISSPSGGGKDAIISALLKRIPRSTRLITTTTRPLRPGNKHGVDYYFITEEEFKKKLNQNKFLEHNIYVGNYYGTEKKILEQALNTRDVVFTNIEVNGKHHIDKAGILNLAIFLLPESLEILHRRIEKRGGLTSEKIKERLEIAQQEIEASKDYDYRIINYDGRMEETVAEIAKIIERELSQTPSVDKNLTLG